MKATAEEIAVAELFSELIAIGTSGIDFPSDALQLCNEAIPTVLGEQWLVRAAEASHIGKGNVHRMFRQAGTRSSLPALVHFCLCNQLSLAQMALGRVEYRRCADASIHHTRPYSPASEGLIRAVIQKSIDMGSIRSLRDLARRLHHHPKTLKEAAPDLIPALNLATLPSVTA